LVVWLRFGSYCVFVFWFSHCGRTSRRINAYQETQEILKISNYIITYFGPKIQVCVLALDGRDANRRQHSKISANDATQPMSGGAPGKTGAKTGRGMKRENEWISIHPPTVSRVYSYARTIKGCY